MIAYKSSARLHRITSIRATSHVVTLFLIYVPKFSFDPLHLIAAWSMPQGTDRRHHMGGRIFSPATRPHFLTALNSQDACKDSSHLG